MNRIPSELIERIFWYLPRPAKCACLSVCTSWHIHLSPLFYDTVCLHSAESIKLFRHSYKGSCIRHIRHVRLGVDHTDEADPYFSSRVNYLFNILKEDLPRVESMVAFFFSDEETSRVDSHKQRMQNTMDQTREADTMAYLSDRLPKMGRALLYVRDISVFRVWGGLDGYLRLFPLLIQLTVEYQSHPTTTGLFSDILRGCPQLLYLTYIPRGHHVFQHDIPPHSLVDLNIEVSRFRADHVYCFKKTLPKLRSLHVTIKNSWCHDATMELLFRTFNHLSNMDVHIKYNTPAHIKQGLSKFWEFISLEGHYKRAVTIVPIENECPHLLLRTYGGTVYYSTLMYTHDPFDYFEECGHRIDTLMLNCIIGHVDAHDLNTVFPNLHELNLSDNTLHMSATTLIHTHLRVMSFGHDCMDQCYLDALSRVYPALNTLSIDYMNWAMEDTPFVDGFYSLCLPWNTLESLNLHFVIGVTKYAHMMIIKRDNQIRKMWYSMNYEFIEIEECHYDDYMNKRPLMIIESPSILTII